MQPRHSTTRLLILAGVAVLGLVAVGPISLRYVADQSGPDAASVLVDGVEYGPMPGHGFSVPPLRLVVHGSATPTDKGRYWEGRVHDATVYAIEGHDLRNILSMRLMRDARDDGGPLGSFLILHRSGALRDLCPYWPADEQPRLCG